jgi:hypothetical protein
MQKMLERGHDALRQRFVAAASHVDRELADVMHRMPRIRGEIRQHLLELMAVGAHEQRSALDAHL